VYEYDYDDEVWLAKNPVVGSSAPEGARLALASFEKIIDLLEGISGALGAMCLARCIVFTGAQDSVQDKATR